MDCICTDNELVMGKFGGHEQLEVCICVCPLPVVCYIMQQHALYFGLHLPSVHAPFGIAMVEFAGWYCLVQCAMYNLLQGYNYTTLLNWNMIRTVTQWMEQNMTDRPKISIFLRPAHNLVHTTTMGPTRVGRQVCGWLERVEWLSVKRTFPLPARLLHPLIGRHGWW